MTHLFQVGLQDPCFPLCHTHAQADSLQVLTKVSTLSRSDASQGTGLCSNQSRCGLGHMPELEPSFWWTRPGSPALAWGSAFIRPLSKEQRGKNDSCPPHTLPQSQRRQGPLRLPSFFPKWQMQDGVPNNATLFSHKREWSTDTYF